MILLLGVIAGGTILIGLPVGRLPNPAPSLKLLLNAAAVGVLVFLVWDVLSHAWEPLDSLLTGGVDTGLLAARSLLFVGGLTAGLLGIAVFERRLRAPRNGAELTPRLLALMIASGIGIHNLAEGLAIGQSAGSGQVSLATVLVIGFALHNATEGFGIVAPLAGDDSRPTWRFLLLLGLIGGGPTLVGTLIGSIFVSPELAIVFLTVAAGSIVYVIIQLLAMAGKSRRPDLVAVGILIGLVAGFATDAVLTVAGA